MTLQAGEGCVGCMSHCWCLNNSDLLQKGQIDKLLQCIKLSLKEKQTHSVPPRQRAVWGSTQLLALKQQWFTEGRTNNEAPDWAIGATKIFHSHSVLPQQVVCPLCHKRCPVRKNYHRWVCKGQGQGSVSLEGHLPDW